MNGANLPVFLLEVNRTIGLILYLAEKGNVAKLFSSVIYN